MKLRIFSSDKGDCLLLEASSGELFLSDGGMVSSMKSDVAAELGKLRDDGRALDLVCISHVDDDHIGGILELLEYEAAWRAFEFHEHSDEPVRKPKVPRPPEIRGILHNGFRDQVTKNIGPIQNLLAASAPVFLGSAVPELVEMGEEMQQIATGVKQAIGISKLVAQNALDIPLNRPTGAAGEGQLLMAGQPGESFALGSMNFQLVGPTATELEALRKGWDDFLRLNKADVKAIRAEMKELIEEFSSGVSTASPFALGEHSWDSIKGVTVPNVASLVFHVEEDGKTLLLTGDGQHDIILDGLREAGLLDANDSMHVTVLKVQHHGSKNNLSPEFARKVTADHYVFCGDGQHGNPSEKVLSDIFTARTSANANERALSGVPANKTFHYWFSTNSAAITAGTAKQKHFKVIEKLVKTLVTKSNGKLKSHFNTAVSITLDI